MADCQLEIMLDTADREFQIGQSVAGQLKVTVSKPQQNVDVAIERACRSSGKGDEQQRLVEELSVFNGELPAGEHLFAFELPLKEEPLSYQGEVVNIDNYLEAFVSPSGGKSIKAEQHIVVNANPELPCEREPEEIFNEDDTIISLFGIDFTLGALFFVLLAIVMVGGIFAYPLFRIVNALVVGDVMTAGFYGVILTTALIASTYYSFKYIKAKAAERKLGKVNLTVDPKLYRGGDEVKVELSFTPPKDIEINKISLQFLFNETNAKGSGDSRQAFVHSVTIDEKVLVENRNLPAGLPFSQNARFVLPQSVMHDFYFYNCHLNWAVRVDIDIPNWPDWHGEEHIAVIA